MYIHMYRLFELAEMIKDPFLFNELLKYLTEIFSAENLLCIRQIMRFEEVIAAPYKVKCLSVLNLFVYARIYMYIYIYLVCIYIYILYVYIYIYIYIYYVYIQV
jgi:hypothetical protein